MQTNPVGLNAIATGSDPVAKNSDVSSDMFLNLLVTQLKNQDPLSPTDNTTFVAQLAQFSQLEGINNLNENFSSVADAMEVLNNFGTAGLIGKNVTVSASSFGHDGASPVPLGYELNNAADTVRLTVFDSTGNVAATSVRKNVPAGSHEFIWDGLDNNGAPLPAGDYDFTISAGDGTGSDLPVETYVSGTVKGVDFFGDEVRIVLDNAMYLASEIKEVF